MTNNPVELRHILHRNPELSFKEFETTKLLTESIRGIDREGRLKIHTPYPTGLLVEYKPVEGEYILFRADIDALPISEENNIDFKSVNQYMHACGHDVHTSILFAFLKYVLESNIKKNILFLFQPAEESGGGAMEFYGTGIFDKFLIKNAFALHVTDEFPEGTAASTKGVLFASSVEINIEFIGESSHVAFPERGKNAFNALRSFTDSVDRIPKDITEPFVFGMGKITAGEVRNITPGFARLEGTIRGLSRARLDGYLEKINRLTQGVEEMTQVKVNIEYGASYPEVLVDDELYDRVVPAISAEFNFIDCGYKMTGEDFGFFSQKYPSFMFWLGTSKDERHGLHNPKFLPNDSAIETGRKMFEIILSKI